MMLRATSRSITTTWDSWTRSPKLPRFAVESEFVVEHGSGSVLQVLWALPPVGPCAASRIVEFRMPFSPRRG